MQPLPNSKWHDWWHAIGADPAQYFKLPSWFGSRRKAYLAGYLEGLHDAARIIEKQRWSREHGSDSKLTVSLRETIKSIHAFHTTMENKHER